MTEVSYRCKLHRYIVYALAVMIGAMAVIWMQMHTTHLAHKLGLPPPLPSLAAVHAVALSGGQRWPVTNKAPVYDCWGGRMHVSMLARVGGCYLLQQTLAELEQARLLVVVHAPQPVGVADARIE